MIVRTAFEMASDGIDEDTIYTAARLRRGGDGDGADAMLSARAAACAVVEEKMDRDRPLRREFMRREMEACSVAQDACNHLLRAGLRRHNRLRFFSTIRRMWPGVEAGVDQCRELLYESMLAEWYFGVDRSIPRMKLVFIAIDATARAFRTWREEGE